MMVTVGTDSYLERETVMKIFSSKLGSLYAIFYGQKQLPLKKYDAENRIGGCRISTNLG